jgi:hypothetical protein
VSGRETVNSYLPFQLSGSNALVIFAALGALAGLYFFFRGFTLRYCKPESHAPGRQAPATPATTTLTSTTTFTTQGSDTLTQDSHSNVIRLSPAGDEPTHAASMTQQGKIAAALLKAGIPNPASWSTTADITPVAVKITDSQTNETYATDSRQTFDRKTSKILKTPAGDPSLRIPPSNSENWASRNPALMQWGGALLALSSVYLLAAHFGWL